MPSDGGLGQLLRKHLPQPEFRLTRVETGATAAGVPDCYWAHRPTKTSGWIENKKTEGWALDVRPLQIGWHLDHYARGVRTYIAVRARGAGSGGAERDGLYLYRGEAAAMLANQGLRLREPWLLGHWPGPPRRWDWARVAELLTLPG